MKIHTRPLVQVAAAVATVFCNTQPARAQDVSKETIDRIGALINGQPSGWSIVRRDDRLAGTGALAMALLDHAKLEQLTDAQIHDLKLDMEACLDKSLPNALVQRMKITQVAMVCATLLDRWVELQTK